MDSPAVSPGNDSSALFDPSKPFQGVVVCCTSIPPEQRTDIAKKAQELGGIHKYDLTPDVTHLIVGEYDTPKYRHVAKERPDIRPMAVGWVDAVMELWVKDSEIDYLALEEAWSLKTFETGGGEIDHDGKPVDRTRLLCCLTGFDDPDLRQTIIEKITANGGAYTGDLTRKVTHLVVCKPEGRKYAAAKSWGIHTVAIEWLQHSVERGMILDETTYDPIIPEGQRGQGAWTRREVRRVSLGKRLREGTAGLDEGKRKLRKTASMKLSSQRENLWGDILGRQSSAEPSGSGIGDPTQVAPSRSFGRQTDEAKPGGTAGSSLPGRLPLTMARATSEENVFSNCCFYIHGFSAPQTEILVNTVTFMGGRAESSMDEASSHPGIIAPFTHRFVIVPQESMHESHPSRPDNVEIVTEFFIEKCLHKKQFFQPAEHVIGRPFPRFPIDGFSALAICTGGFTGVDLNQVDKAIRQLGAKYEERFTAQSSVLVCGSLDAVRRQKLDLALAWKVPVVSGDWLWECILTGEKAPFQKFLFPELKQRLVSESIKPPVENVKQTVPKNFQEFAQKPPGKGHVLGVDMSAFDKDPISPQNVRPQELPKEESYNTHFETAPTQQAPTKDSGSNSAPLSEASANSLNKSASPRRYPLPDSDRKPLTRVHSEIGDSEAAEDEDFAQGRDVNDALPDIDTEPDAIDLKRIARQKAAAAAVERIALSTKLTSLLEASTGGSGGSSLDGALAGEDDTSARPARRKRGIMGRAISNVSAASSGSVDSAAGVGQPKAKAASATTSFSVGLGGESLADEDDANATPKPPSTQLEYEDPEAKRYKAQLLNKMMGVSAGNVPRQEEKITLRDLQGLGTDAAPTTGRARTTRRR